MIGDGNNTVFFPVSPTFTIIVADSVATNYTISIILHGINTILSMALSQTLLIERVPSLSLRNINIFSGLGAILFASHPVRVEVVCWASCQPYLLGTLFSLLSCLACSSSARACYRWMCSCRRKNSQGG